MTDKEYSEKLETENVTSYYENIFADWKMAMTDRNYAFSHLLGLYGTRRDDVLNMYKLLTRHIDWDFVWPKRDGNYLSPDPAVVSLTEIAEYIYKLGEEQICRQMRSQAVGREIIFNWLADQLHSQTGQLIDEGLIVNAFWVESLADALSLFDSPADDYTRWLRFKEYCYRAHYNDGDQFVRLALGTLALALGLDADKCYSRRPGDDISSTDLHNIFMYRAVSNLEYVFLARYINQRGKDALANALYEKHMPVLSNEISDLLPGFKEIVWTPEFKFFLNS